MKPFLVKRDTFPKHHFWYLFVTFRGLEFFGICIGKGGVPDMGLKIHRGVRQGFCHVRASQFFVHFVYPIRPMGLVYLLIHLLENSTIHVAKYIRIPWVWQERKERFRKGETRFYRNEDIIPIGKFAKETRFKIGIKGAAALPLVQYVVNL